MSLGRRQPQDDDADRAPCTITDQANKKRSKSLGGRTKTRSPSSPQTTDLVQEPFRAFSLSSIIASTIASVAISESQRDYYYPF